LVFSLNSTRTLDADPAVYFGISQIYAKIFVIVEDPLSPAYASKQGFAIAKKSPKQGSGNTPAKKEKKKSTSTSCIYIR
jgi:hypothetical protein